MVLSVADVVGKAVPIIIAILFFGLIILSHELGHFSLARLFKVKINEFSMGMGPVILKKKGKETQYSLRLFPIGGFVSMEGEDEDSSDERAFCNKPVWQRFLVVLAGATVNILFGAVLLAILISQQDLVGTNQIHSFDEGSRLEATGLMPKDIIKKINGRTVFSSNDISYLMYTDDDGRFDFIVERNGEKISVDDVEFTYTEKDGIKNYVFDMTIVGVEKSVPTVFAAACKQTVSVARMVWMSLGDLVTGKYGLKDLSGPIGTVGFIADTAEQSVKETDYSALVNIMAFIAINIGVFNLLPVPALDGGRLFFMLIEMIFRRPIPAKYENWIHAAGMILLLLFMAVVSFSDIFKMIGGNG